MSVNILERGKRAFVTGKTGSGKSAAGFFLAHHVPDYPVYIMDTKIESMYSDKLKGVSEIINGVKNYDPTKAKAPFVILRPNSDEFLQPQLLDDVVWRIHDGMLNCCVLIDEALQLHNQGRAGPGLIGLLTRGRSRGQSTIVCTQRPAWVSLYCMTEADRYYQFRLANLQDRKRMREFIPDDLVLQQPDKYHFFYYDVDYDDAEYYEPFPLDAGDDVRADILDSFGHVRRGSGLKVL